MFSNVCIIVPCYNEALRLESGRFLEFARANNRYRFVLVNDGSRDATVDVLQSLQRRLPNQFEVLDLKRNGGKAEAVRRGIRHGLDRSPAFIGFWDADLATPLTAIPEFTGILDSRSDIDLVIGSRMPLLGRRIQRNFLRQKIGTVCSSMASLALGNRVRDTQCGAKLFRVTPVTRHIFEQPLRSRWLFDVELFARLIGAWQTVGDRPFAERVFEYPLQQWDEISGSSLKRMDFVKAGLELCGIYWRYLGPFASPSDYPEYISDTEHYPDILPLEKRAA